MNKAFLVFPCALIALAACASNPSKVSSKVWNMNPVEMCSTLITQNKAALDKIECKYGAELAAEIKPLYQELDLQTNAVCRMRMARQFQNEQIETLRMQYQIKIDNKIMAYKAAH